MHFQHFLGAIFALITSSTKRNTSVAADSLAEQFHWHIYLLRPRCRSLHTGRAIVD